MTSVLIALLTLISKTNALDRIEKVKVDIKKPFLLHMHAGRSTILDLPCSVSYAVPGSLSDLDVEIGPDKDSSVVLWLKSQVASPTNLTLRCDNRIIVFDILPGRQHRDYINITSFESFSTDKKLISASDAKASEQHKYNKKKLLKASDF